MGQRSNFVLPISPQAAKEAIGLSLRVRSVDSGFETLKIEEGGPAAPPGERGEFRRGCNPMPPTFKPCIMRKDDPVLLRGKQELRFIIGAQAARISGRETIHPVREKHYVKIN